MRFATSGSCTLSPLVPFAGENPWQRDPRAASLLRSLPIGVKPYQVNLELVNDASTLTPPSLDQVKKIG
jgi:hypothetical protein